MSSLGVCRQCGDDLQNNMHYGLCDDCTRDNENDEILDRPTDYDNED